MNRSRILKLAGFLGLVLAMFGGWLWYQNALLGGPLEGTTRHDFGEVVLIENPATVQHRFTLRNREAHFVELLAAKPDCGCVSVDLAPQTIEPGQSIEVPVTMRVHPGSTNVRIELALGDAGIQTMWVRATGKQPSTLSTEPPEIWFEPGQSSASLKLIASVFDSTRAPMRAILRGPADLAADVGEWKLAWQPRTSNAPMMWESSITIRSQQPQSLVGATFEFAVEGIGTTSVTVISPDQATAARARPRSLNESLRPPTGPAEP